MSGVFVLLTLVLSSLFVSPSASKKEQIAVARKEDIPFIRCQVCETVARQLFSQVERKSSEISPKKISEYQIIEIAENICDLKKHGGDWMLRIDIVEKGDALELVEQESEGQCNSECKTIERACQEVMGYHDTDVAEFVFKSKPQLNQLINYICKDLSKACSSKPPPVPVDRVPGEPFVPKSSKEAEMEKILRSMEGMPGAPSMKMYSKEDLLNMQNFGDDEDEEDDELTSNLRNAWKNKEPKKADWKQKLAMGINDVKTGVSKHLRKASLKIQKWWRGKKTGSRSSKSSKAEL
ncbi:uncharacterized protein LOC116250261 [Nymphaea colorata]|nr:uncharacterized protein LOC116250261 [Nymphaea colorata]